VGLPRPVRDRTGSSCRPAAHGAGGHTTSRPLAASDHGLAHHGAADAELFAQQRFGGAAWRPPDSAPRRWPRRAIHRVAVGILDHYLRTSRGQLHSTRRITSHASGSARPVRLAPRFAASAQYRA
jgi:hypothetical protein